MQVLRSQNILEIILFKPEASFLRKALSEVLKNYQADPEDLDEAIKSLWYHKRPNLDEDDFEIWTQNLREFQGKNTILAEKMVNELKVADRWPLILKLETSEADSFLTIINDQRLLLAATHEIGEEEMGVDREFFGSSSEEVAMMTIHFLAWLMELIILRLEEPDSLSQDTSS